MLLLLLPYYLLREQSFSNVSYLLFQTACFSLFFFDEDRITEGSKGKESSVLFIFWLDDLRTYVVAYQPPVIKTNIIYLYLPMWVPRR